MAGTTFAQERAEKNVSVDCGKGNTFHKVHGFVGCFISHSDDFQGAIDHIIDDDLFISFTKNCARIKGLAFRFFFGRRKDTDGKLTIRWHIFFIWLSGGQVLRIFTTKLRSLYR